MLKDESFVINIMEVIAGLTVNASTELLSSNIKSRLEVVYGKFSSHQSYGVLIRTLSKKGFIKPVKPRKSLKGKYYQLTPEAWQAFKNAVPGGSNATEGANITPSSVELFAELRELTGMAEELDKEIGNLHERIKRLEAEKCTYLKRIHDLTKPPKMDELSEVFTSPAQPEPRLEKSLKMSSSLLD